MKERERTILDCFQSWIEKDESKFRESFAPDARYIESWGPAYHFSNDIARWFTEWNADNSVLKWDIKRFWHKTKLPYVKGTSNAGVKGKQTALMEYQLFNLMVGTE